jgi:hypothetical protein
MILKERMMEILLNLIRSIREALGYDVNGTDWIDIDSYDPSTFNIDMFSADDLLNIGGTSICSDIMVTIIQEKN